MRHHDNGGDRRQQAGQHIKPQHHRAGIHAGIARRHFVGADHVDFCAEGRAVEHDRNRDDAGNEDQQRHRHGVNGAAEDHAIAQRGKGVGKTGNHIAACRANGEALAQRHGAQRRQNRRDAEIGDDKTVDEADDRRNAQARQHGERNDADLGGSKSLRRVARENEGHHQRAEIGGGDDRQVEAARQQRDHHRERENAEFRYLERHRAQRFWREQLVANDEAEDAKQRGEHDQQCRQRAGAGIACKTLAEAGAGGGYVTHARAARLRAGRCDHAVADTAMRMTRPTNT